MSKKIPNDLIEKIRIANPIEDVISEYVDLKKQGKNYVGLCPFHNDQKPSMMVSPEKKIFKCFSCNTGGNVFSFISNFKNISFPEAVIELGKQKNINVSLYVQSSSKKSWDQESEKIFKINEEALNYFKYSLENETSKKIIDFLKERNLTKPIIEKFNIGLVLDKGGLTKFLINKGYSKLDIVNSGLGVVKGDEIFDFFFNRIMFPIKNHFGKIIGFSGRTFLNDLNSKYINTFETKVFKKGELLYNYDIAKNNVKTKNQLIVVEGFMDVIALSKIGLDNVVAIMGTNLSSSNIQFLRQVTKEIVLALDNDNPGIEAMLKIAKNIKLTGFNNVFLIKMLKGFKDFDEMIHSKEKNKINLLFEKKILPLEFEINYLKTKIDITMAHGKDEYLNKLVASLKFENNELLLSHYIRKISKIIHFPEDKILRMVAKEKFVISKTISSNLDINDSTKILKKGRKTSIDKVEQFKINENKILSIGLSNKEMFELILAKNQNHWWSKKNKVIAMYLKKHFENNDKLQLDQFLDLIEDQVIKEKVIFLITKSQFIEEKKEFDKKILNDLLHKDQGSKERKLRYIKTNK